MISASPLVKNDPRITELVKKLAEGMSLQAEAKTMGYGDENQLRYALRELAGEKSWLAAMKARPGSYRSRL